MAEPALLPSIAALPTTTVRQLGSSNVLRDPSSVVKELIDNALDARANAIFVDISANTLDSIQVKDTGHGVSAEDRPLVCRRYCTSKIRDFRDLDEIGGKWLGFRGEALASMAEMSGTMEVTTRVEGEQVAARLKYGRDGELLFTENASAPVGTTVKITKFFQTLPVRKSAALKEPTKTIAKIKCLLQSYAFARPSVRFSLRVLKGKANKDDFMYAPKKDGNVEDAVLKFIGKECALQCDWTAIESDGFEIHAFLPKPDALGSKIAKLGVFLSVDRRPVSTGRGTPKKIATFFKERLRKANISCSSVKDPFLCMNVICPPGSYDPNIEPAKDDVLFEREDVVMSAVNKLFMAYYPEAVAVSDAGDDSKLSTLEQPSDRTSAATPTTRPDTAFSILEEAPTARSKRPETAFSILEEAAPTEDARRRVGPNSPPRWRSSMYGIDEDDLEFLDYENQPPVIEEEEDGRRAASVSNPWTIARMTASLKPKQTTRNSQLLTPAKGQSDVGVGSSSPLLAPHTRQRLPLEPLTPETASRLNAPRLLRDPTSQQSIERVSQVSGRRPHLPIDQENIENRKGPLTRSTRGAAPIEKIPSSSSALRRSGRHQEPGQQSLHAFEGRPGDNDWFGKPMRGQAPPRPSRARKARQTQGLDHSMFDSDNVAVPLTSNNNTDIRDFIGRGKPPLQRSTSFEPTPGPSSFTPINGPFKQPRVLDLTQDMQQRHLTGLGTMSRASSAELPQLLQRGKNQPLPNSDGCEPLDFVEQLRAYAKSGGSQRPRSVEPDTILPTAHAAVSRDVPSESSRLPTGARPRTSANEMAAMFAAYSAKPNVPAETIPATRASRSRPSRKTPKRRRTTDGAQRTKSSHLQLERVPHGYCIHDVLLQLSISITHCTKAMLKLDMRRNTVEWGYPADVSAYDGLGMGVPDGMLAAWVLRIDSMLEAFDTRADREGVLGTLEQGIREAFRQRNGGDFGAGEEYAGVGETVEKEGNCSDEEAAVGLPQLILAASTEPESGDHACLGREGGEDEFGEDVDDDVMLLAF